MSRKERKREAVMGRVLRGETLLKEAAWEMNVSLRQAVRIKNRFLREGGAGLVHRSRDVPSNRRLDPQIRERVLEACRERYLGFGPTLAGEKLEEHEGIRVGRETLRRWMIADGLWRVGRKERVHRQRRPRRDCFGELLQIDGSVHPWFEGRGPRATLMVLIDDATGRLMLHMAAEETTRDALWLLRKWVSRYGIAVALYADRRTVYFTGEWVHEPDRRGDPETFTDFMRCADRMKIEMIPAYSPQAKGRVERANGTLQDRLVKELRLRGISTIEEANAMLDAYADEFNERFACPPRSDTDAHRVGPKSKAQWDSCFCTEETRTVARDNTVAYRGAHWQILPQPNAPRPGTRIVRRHPIGSEDAYWAFDIRRLKTRLVEPGQPRRKTPNERPKPKAGASPRAPGI